MLLEHNVIIVTRHARKSSIIITFRTTRKNGQENPSGIINNITHLTVAVVHIKKKNNDK